MSGEVHVTKLEPVWRLGLAVLALLLTAGSAWALQYLNAVEPKDAWAGGAAAVAVYFAAFTIVAVARDNKEINAKLDLATKGSAAAAVATTAVIAFAERVEPNRRTGVYIVAAVIGVSAALLAWFVSKPAKSTDSATRPELNDGAPERPAE